MKKSLLSLAFLLAFFLVGSAHAMEAASTYSYFCIGVENEVEGEKIFVKTLYVPNGEILETTHKEGDEIEFGKTFAVKFKIKHRKGSDIHDYYEIQKKENKKDTVSIGNEESLYSFFPISADNGPEAPSVSLRKDISCSFRKKGFSGPLNYLIQCVLRKNKIF